MLPISTAAIIIAFFPVFRATKGLGLGFTVVFDLEDDWSAFEQNTLRTSIQIRDPDEGVTSGVPETRVSG